MSDCLPPLPDIAAEADRIAVDLSRLWFARTDPNGERTAAMIAAHHHLRRMADYVRRVREAVQSDG